MDKEKILKDYTDVLDQVIRTSEFFSIYLQNPYGHSEELDESDIIPHISFYAGATRGCFVDDRNDYVVKFDIDYDGTNNSSCERETRIYEWARERHCENYLCEVMYIGEYVRDVFTYCFNDCEDTFDWTSSCELIEELENNRHKLKRTQCHICLPLYAYRRANLCWSSVNKKYSDDVTTLARCITSPLNERNLAIALQFIDEYGFEEYERFSDFARDAHINDLHSGNVGRINGHLCLIDYAGYHSSCSASFESSKYSIYGEEEYEDEKENNTY